MTETRLPPNQRDAEESVIGSLLIDASCLSKVSFLKPDDFFSECRSIYEVCVQLNERHEKINQITVAIELNRQGKLVSSGGSAYLSTLIANTPTSLDAEHYANIVHRMSVSRRIISAASSISELGYSESPDTDGMIKQARDILSKVEAQAGIRKLDIVTPHEMGNAMLNMLQVGTPSLRWGFKELDRVTMGLYPGDYILIGARPSTGKTQLMLNAAKNIALCGKSVLFASTEMGMGPVIERYIAEQLGISVRQLRDRSFTLEQEERFMEASGTLSQLPVYYLYGSRSSDSIWRQASKMQEIYGLDVVFIDYLQLLDDCYEGGDSQNVRVSKVSKNIKSMQNDLGVPVVVASQLSRGLENRDDKAPKLQDLRDSGSLEQDADTVLLLHRPEFYVKDMERERLKGTLEILMAKNRQLGTDINFCKLKWIEAEHRYLTEG
jgi:replicative DNA helicase